MSESYEQVLRERDRLKADNEKLDKALELSATFISKLNASEIDLQQRNDKLIGLVQRLTYSDDCAVDHNGFCQVHMCQSPCADKDAKDYIAALTADKSEGGKS